MYWLHSVVLQECSKIEPIVSCWFIPEITIVLPDFSLMSSGHALKEAKPALSLLNANGFLKNSMFLQSNALA